MKIIGTPTSNILRQTGEYQQMVKYSELGNLLNRRGEWGQNLPPKLIIEEDEKGGKRSRDQHQAGRPACVTPGSTPKERSPPPPPPESKRPRKLKSEGIELEDRVRLAPKEKKVLTVKEMMKRIAERRLEVADRPTSGGLPKIAKLKNTEKDQGSDDPMAQPRIIMKPIMSEKVPSQLGQESLHKEVNSVGKHLVKSESRKSTPVPDEDLSAGIYCQLPGASCQVVKVEHTTPD